MTSSHSEGTCVADAQNDDDDNNGCEEETTTTVAETTSSGSGVGETTTVAETTSSGSVGGKTTSTTTTNTTEFCGYALEIYQGIQQNCPAQCSTDGSNPSLRECRRGEVEIRTPDTCGAEVGSNKCGKFFGSLTEDMFDVFWENMQTCADETGEFKGFAAWAADGYEQFFEFQFHFILMQCGLANQIAYDMNPKTCGGGMAWIVALRDSCPANDDKYEEFSADSCGEEVNGNKCGKFLVEVSDKLVTQVSAGLNSCEDAIAPLKELYLSGNIVATRWSKQDNGFFVHQLASNCGLSDQIGRSKSIYCFHENLLENTLMGGTPSVCSRDGRLLPSSHADARSPDDVVAS